VNHGFHAGGASGVKRTFDKSHNVMADGRMFAAAVVARSFVDVFGRTARSKEAVPVSSAVATVVRENRPPRGRSTDTSTWRLARLTGKRMGRPVSKDREYRKNRRLIECEFTRLFSPDGRSANRTEGSLTTAVMHQRPFETPYVSRSMPAAESLSVRMYSGEFSISATGSQRGSSDSD
jgi:hypothetical protein